MSAASDAALRDRAVAIGRAFPPGFTWGAATAAAQIEGSVTADGRTDSIWDTFARIPGAVRAGDTPSIADDHYRLWREDVRIMAELGLTGYRFSTAWPRIVPNADGAIEQRGLDFYDGLVDELLANGIRPFLTLFHWDLPQWQQDAGGWPERSTAERFAEYAAAVAGRLGDRVASWSTLNEPWCFTFLGHLEGFQAPGQRDAGAATRAMHHALLAHGLGVQALRAALPSTADVGIAISTTPCEPASTSTEDLEAYERFDLYRNRLFLHPITHGEYHPATEALLGQDIPIEEGDLEIIAQPIDFVGINVYSRGVVVADDTVPLVRARENKPEGLTYTDIGWEVHPPAIAQVLTEVHDRYAPKALYITENGSAWNDGVEPDGSVIDIARIDYLAGHLEAAAAIDADIPFRGYFAWSLLDNFEWSEGYAMRFGIVRVDYDTQKRTVKRSGEFYRDVIAAHAAQGSTA